MATKSNASPREGLTFDDVLIKPGLSEVLPCGRRYPLPDNPLDRSQYSRSSPRPWTP